MSLRYVMFRYVELVLEYVVEAQTCQVELTYAELGLIYVELDPRLGGIFISFLLSLGRNSEWKTKNNFQTPSPLLFLAAAFFALELHLKPLVSSLALQATSEDLPVELRPSKLHLVFPAASRGTIDGLWGHFNSHCDTFSCF